MALPVGYHGIWDQDIPAAPILADVTINGRLRKLVAQPTKQAFLYVFDRITGEPIWPIEELPVEIGSVPGEWYSPTQPFPTKPPAYDRQGVSEDDLIDFSPELRAKALEIASWYKLGPLFTPPVVSSIDGPLGILMSPSTGGGTNWPGGSFDPETGMLYTSNSSMGALNYRRILDSLIWPIFRGMQRQGRELRAEQVHRRAGEEQNFRLGNARFRSRAVVSRPEIYW